MTRRSSLIKRFQDQEYRQIYVESFIDSSIATQIKVLRDQRDLTQTDLADLAAMKQGQISRLEKVNNERWKVITLRRIARALDLALVVRFESFGNVIPDVESFERKTLQRPSFADDPMFSEQSQSQLPAEGLAEFQVHSDHVSTDNVLRFEPRMRDIQKAQTTTTSNVREAGGSELIKAEA